MTTYAAASTAEHGYFDTRHLVVTILLSLMVVGGLALLPKLWRMEADIQRAEATEKWWPFSEALRAGFVRSIPTALLTCTFLALAGVTGFFEKLWTGPRGELATTVTLWLGLGFIVMLVVDASVTLFNQPKFVVPPAARDEPGAVSLWWSNRRFKRK